MKVEILGKPVFYFPVTAALVDTLIELSGEHYDATCRAAGKVGGLIYGWKNRIEFSEGKSKVQASFSEVDLTLKIIELAAFCKPTKYVELMSFANALKNMLSVSQTRCDKWRIKVEV